LVVFIIFVNGIWAEISVLSFILVVNISISSVIWIYIPEILPDVGMGLSFVMFWLSDAILIFIYPIMVQLLTL